MRVPGAHMCTVHTSLGTRTRTRKRLILKDSSARSVWTYLTLQPVLAILQTQARQYHKRGREREGDNQPTPVGCYVEYNYVVRRLTRQKAKIFREQTVNGSDSF